MTNKNTNDLEEMKQIINSFAKVNDGYTMMGTNFCDSLVKTTGGCPMSKNPGEIQCPSFMKCLTKSISSGMEMIADFIVALPLIPEDNVELRNKAYTLLKNTMKSELSASRLLVYKIFIDADRKIENLNSPN